MESVTVNAPAILTIEELQARMAEDRAELARRAETKRDEAASIVRTAQAALAEAIQQAQQLEEEAEALDGNVRPKLTGAEVPKPKRTRKPKLESTAEPATKLAEPKPARQRKQKAPPTAVESSVTSDGKVPTAAAVLKILNDQKLNKLQIAKAGGFDRAALTTIIGEMLEAGTLKGKGQGAGKRYWAAK